MIMKRVESRSGVRCSPRRSRCLQLEGGLKLIQQNESHLTALNDFTCKVKANLLHAPDRETFKSPSCIHIL